MNSFSTPVSPYSSGGSSQERTETDESGLSFAVRYPLLILVAEDNYINRRVFMMFLKHLGYHADCVEDGLECLNLARQGKYDLILTDVDMPVMSGIECTRELRKAGFKGRIVAITGSILENPRRQCLDAGMDGFLPKPFSQQELRIILTETYRAKLAKADGAR
jgi:CheY-like chemotaxis protein